MGFLVPVLEAIQAAYSLHFAVWRPQGLSDASG